MNGGTASAAPTLQGLGAQGATFLDATAQVPLTLPSHASIFTGRYPLAHGVRDNSGFVLSPTLPTLASLLRGAGYHTAAFVSSFVLRGATGLSNGFELYDDHFEGAGRARLTASALERRGPEVGRLAAAWLRTAPEPFFLWVHFYDPHAPYDPPPAFAAKHPGQPYDGEVATSDFGLSMVLDAIPADRRAGTLVIATADHGESLGEHGESEHGILLYDATLHVPLVMRGPGVPAGVTVRRQVRHVDLVPTIAELVGVEAPSGLDGVSLVPLVTGRGGNGGHDAPLSYAESEFGARHFGWRAIHAARDGAWKYIDAPTPELYDVSADPGERENRHVQRTATAGALAGALAALIEKAGPANRAQATATDRETAERLRSLGYVSGQVGLERAGRAGEAGGAGGAGGADPKDEIARYEQYVTIFNDGLASLETGRTAAAESTFRRLAMQFPRAFEAHQYLARTLRARRALPQAIAELDVAIGLAPREAVLYFDAARVLADARQFDRAVERVAAGRRIEPASFYGALTEGMVALAAALPERAERAFREALVLNPELAAAHFELGRLAEARGDREAARAEYQRALDGDATLEEARRAIERLADAAR